jgi:hypothetical protein
VYLPKTLHTFDIYYNINTILQYPSIYIHIRWNCHETLYSAPFCLVTNTIFQDCHGASLFYQDVDGMPWHLCWNQNSSIFRKFHTSYWLIKYLNPKLISRDSINTCWTYIRRYQNHLRFKGSHWNFSSFLTLFKFLIGSNYYYLLYLFLPIGKFGYQSYYFKFLFMNNYYILILSYQSHRKSRIMDLILH